MACSNAGPTSNDRATSEYRIEVYSGGKVALTLDGKFAQWQPEKSWVTHLVDVPQVEHIRISVKSWHGKGAGLAEVKLD